LDTNEHDETTTDATDTTDSTSPAPSSGSEQDPDAEAPPPPRKLPPVVLAVDIGGTKFAAGLVSPRGELVDRAVVLVDQNAGPEAHFKSLAGIVEQQLDAAEHHEVRIASVGVGSAGPITRHCETISPVNIPAWREFPMRSRLAELTGLRVYGDLDGKALALAEGWQGAAKGLDSYCVLTVSTGIGGGIVLDGELLDGASANAGHLGHIIVEPNGRRCGCGARGCLEAEASGVAIEAITGRSPTEPTYEIMQRTGRLVGRAVASLCTLLDLELVVVGGGVALGFAATFFNAANEELSTTAHLPFTRHARITPTRLGDRGPLIGAGAVGIRGMRRH
jgi:glucokinase